MFLNIWLQTETENIVNWYVMCSMVFGSERLLLRYNNSLPIFLHNNIINYYDILIFMTAVVRVVRLRVNISAHDVYCVLSFCFVTIFNCLLPPITLLLIIYNVKVLKIKKTGCRRYTRCEQYH